MRVLLQRVTHASVSVDGQVVGAIDAGLLALVCAMQGDTAKDATMLASKTAKLRIFADTAGKKNHSLLDVGGACLVVSQFTLAADTRHGNRPSYLQSLVPDKAIALCHQYTATLEGVGVSVRTGVFGAHMQIELCNDGPVTLWLDSAC